MIPDDFIYFIIAGFMLMAMPIGLIAWFQAGFFTRWMKVRASRGKLTLVKTRGKLRDFWEVGEIKGHFLIVGKKEEKKRIVLEDNVVYRCFGVTVVDHDETSNALSKTNYESVTGFDAPKFEDLYTRALFRPTLEENKDKIVLILLIIVIAGLAINAFMTFNVTQQLAKVAAASVSTVL